MYPHYLKIFIVSLQMLRVLYDVGIPPLYNARNISNVGDLEE